MLLIIKRHSELIVFVDLHQFSNTTMTSQVASLKYGQHLAVTAEFQKEKQLDELATIFIQTKSAT